jgi:hypothetical protein
VDAPIELPVLTTAASGTAPALRGGASSPARTHARPALRLRWAAFGTALAAAAALLLMMRPFAPGRQPPKRTLAIKGGELAIGLVRERAGEIAHEPSRFAPGDRFKVLLTCPPNMRPYVDVVVFQGEQTFFPLQATRIAQCGNALALPGAFALDGTADVLVCTIASETGSVQRAALIENGRKALPALSVCETLSPTR